MDVFQNILLGFAAIAIVRLCVLHQQHVLDRARRPTDSELALLRSIGATGQITRSVIVEATIVGLTARDRRGVRAGDRLGPSGDSRRRGLRPPPNSLVLLGRTWLAAVVVGLGVTLVAAIMPARRVSAMPPVEGIREGFVVTHPSERSPSHPRGCSHRLWRTAGLLRPVRRRRCPAGPPLLGLGAIMVFLGVAQLSPVVAVPVRGRSER